MLRIIHISWIIAWISVGILIGISSSLKFGDNFTNLSWLIAGISFCAISLINRKIFIVSLAIVGGLLIGLNRGSAINFEQTGYNKFFNQQISVSGVVAEDTAFSSKGQQRIKLKDIIIADKSLPGQVWVSTPDLREVKRSDQLIVQGRLSNGFGSFPATIFQAEILKVNRIKGSDPALEIRDKFAVATRNGIEEPQSSLGIGFVTGQHSTLPEDLSNNLKMLGLTHIVVASGYNLTILVRFARRLFARVSKYLATLVSLTMICCFMLVTGFSPSMSRAGLIAVLSLAAWYFGRRIHPFVLLPFSAAITAFINPSFMWGDLGWYLSFAAFAGVLILSPLLLDYFWGNKRINQAHQIFIETVSAQIATAPIIAYTFSTYAPLSLVANLLILPLIPAVMALTFLAGSGSLFFSTLAPLFGFPAGLTLSYMTKVINGLASLPFSQGSITVGVPQIVAVYIAIIFASIYMKRRTRHNFKQDSIIE